jgi:hypothetical protein
METNATIKYWYGCRQCGDQDTNASFCGCYRCNKCNFFDVSTCRLKFSPEGVELDNQAAYFDHTNSYRTQGFQRLPIAYSD